MPTIETLNAALPDVFRVLDLTGVFLNGMIGGRLARQKHFDAVGFAVLALMSALGGGMIRDTLLQAGPPVALTDPYYLGTALIGACVAFLWKLESKIAVRAILVADGLVLGTWAATGTMKTLALGFAVMPAILLGVTTAVGGGMIRDVSAGNVPMVFGGNHLYATPAVVASIIMVIFFSYDLDMIGMLVATIVGSSFTLVAHWRRWQLPTHADWTLTLTSTQLRYLRKRRGAGWRLTDQDIRNLKKDNPAPPLAQTALEDAQVEQSWSATRAGEDDVRFGVGEQNRAPRAAEDDGPAQPESDRPAQPESDCLTQPESDCLTQSESDCPAQPESDCPAEPESDRPAQPESDCLTQPEPDCPAQPEEDGSVRTDQ